VRGGAGPQEGEKQGPRAVGYEAGRSQRDGANPDLPQRDFASRAALGAANLRYDVFPPRLVEPVIPHG